MQEIQLRRPIYIPKKKKETSRWLALIVVLTAPLLYVIDIFIINMAIPAIQAGVHASGGETQLIIAGYLLGSAAFLIIGGRAGDYLGRKKVFFRGMLFFTLTSCLCGLSQTAFQLNAMRFLQGISSSFMVPQAIAFIHVLFEHEQEKAKAVGWYGTTLSIAAIIGQILGGYLADAHLAIEGWRLIFFINLPVGLLSMWAISKYLPKTPGDTSSRFDYPGAAILTTALICLIYPLTEGREAGWPLWSIIMLLLSLLLFVYFVRNQQRNPAPLIDMSLFKIREFNIGLLAVLFHFMMHTAYLFISAVYLQQGLGVTALTCGMYFIPHACLFMLAAMLASRLTVRYGKRVLQLGVVIIMLSFILQLIFFTPQASGFTLMLLIGLYGFGNGFVLPSLLSIVLGSIPGRYAGVAAGIFSTSQQTASALGISILGGVFYYALSLAPQQPDYGRAFDYGIVADIAGLCVAGIMLVLLPDVKGRRVVAEL